MKATITTKSAAGFTVTFQTPDLENRLKLLEILPRFEDELLEAGYTPVEPAAPVVVTAPAPAPAAAPVNGGSFAAVSLTATVDDGKAYWRVKGGEYQKFGVAIYPEVLEAAGLVDLNPLRPLSLAGWTAHYVTNDNGNPRKVVRLEKA